MYYGGAFGSRTAVPASMALGRDTLSTTAARKLSKTRLQSGPVDLEGVAGEVATRLRSKAVSTC
eukprot:6211194-Pleurochrysis_carterae.AAC.7